MAGVQQQKQRVFSGVVSKMHDTFGFVDEDVFFQVSACEGGVPSVGDRVIVEAQFNPSMPFKWNASRVQIDQQQIKQLQAAPSFGFQGGPVRGGQQGRGQQPHLYAMQNQALGYAQRGRGGAGILGPAPVNMINSHMAQQRKPMSGGKRNAQGGHKRNAAQRSGGRDRRMSPHRGNDRNRSRDEPPRKKKSKTPPQRKRSPSPSSHRRSISIDKSARRPAPRYMVQYAKYPLNRKCSDVLALRNLFSGMYIPSDFFNVDYKWQDCFPMRQPVSVEKCQFHVFHKDVEPLDAIGADMLDPPDANHSWTARVMLMQLPGLNEMYKQCCSLAEDESTNFYHPHRLYKFLVGYKGKKEPMAIGGLWSPSLDGPDPAKNPLTLVKTAIRTCKALTGIDLSKCSKWYRILEIQYHRKAEVRKGREVPDRVETTVIYLPDVHSCMPTASEYSALRLRYLDKLEACLNVEESASEEKPDDTAETKAMEDANVSASEAADASDDPPDQKDEDASAVQEAEGQTQNGKLTSDITSEAEQLVDETKPQTPSKSDIKTMKVGDLRKELESRGLSAKGLKATLVNRLADAIQKESEEEAEREHQEEEEEVMDTDALQAVDASAVADAGDAKVEEEKTSEKDDNQDEKTVKMEEEKMTDEKQEEEKAEKKEEKQIDPERLRRHYTLPESRPAIPVHPNTAYKRGIFECSTAYLSTLLGYRLEDNKESIFEVSVFAEAFKEMLQRGFAFTIYEALANPMPELQKEEEGEEDEEPKTKRAKSESDETEQDEKSDAKDESDKGKLSHDNEKDNIKDDKGVRNPHHPPKSEEHTEKSVTVRRDLLLAFVYFDHTHCGFIKGPDLNDIIHSIGLGLSRSQISKLTSRYLDHDVLHYRKLTDVLASKVPEFRDLLEKANKKTDVDSLLQGNKSLLPATKNAEQNLDSGETPVLKTGLALYNGVVVDIGLLQAKLRSSEDTRVELESALETVKDELGSTSRQLSKAQKEYESLESDFEATKKKLMETQANFKSAADVKSKYEKALKSVVSTVETVLPKAAVLEDEK